MQMPANWSCLFPDGNSENMIASTLDLTHELIDSMKDGDNDLSTFLSIPDDKPEHAIMPYPSDLASSDELSPGCSNGTPRSAMQGPFAPTTPEPFA